MAMTNADNPVAEPEPKAKKSAEPALADATKSTDPLVMKLVWDRAAAGAAALTDFHNVSSDAHGNRVAAIDTELAKLGFKVP